jgi:alkylmercury lyase
LDGVVEYWSDFFESLGHEGRQLFSQTVRLLAKGVPVSLSQVARAAQIPPDRLSSAVRGLGVEFDGKGNVVGLGLSLNPTPHRVRLATSDAQFYAWCAPDTLVFPIILKRTIRVESEDPLTGERIRLTVGLEGVKELDPKGALVSLVSEPDAADIRGSACDHQHFFSSLQTAEKYGSNNRAIIILAVEEAYGVLLKILDRFEDVP